MGRLSKRCAECAGYGVGRSVMSSGYVRVWSPDHALAMRDGYVLEHRYVLHQAGVDIPEGCHVHHVNGDKADDRIENLAVVTPKQHTRIHLEESGVVLNQYGAWKVIS